MFTISVCMITKNEELVLDRILTCAKEFADEIIVVDTGSIDKTVEIAKKFTNKVFTFPWINDFSKARNYSFSKATCDYQMWLDADDIISQENISKILQLKQNAPPETDVYMFKYCIGINENGTPYMSFYRERLLKRLRNFQWEGFVHEAISPIGNIEYLDIEIQHKKEKNGDAKRNLKLYQIAIKNGSVLNARETYYYARELYYNGYISKAITLLKQFLNLANSFAPDNYGAYLLLAECYMLKNQQNKAQKILFQCLEKHLPTAELCCKIGDMYDVQNDKEKAVFWYKTALICPAQLIGFVRKEYSDLIPCLQLTKLLYQTNFEEAKTFHQKAQAIAPNHPSVVFNNRFF